MLSRHPFAVAVLLLTSAAASAQQLRLAPDDPAADRLVSEALRKTPELVAARAALEAARRRVEPSRTLPDPSASLTYQNDGSAISLGKAEGSFFGLMVSQPLPWPGKLDLAGKAFSSEAKEIELGPLSRAAMSTEASVRDAWYDLLLARALDGLVEERRATATQLESNTRDRYAAGLSAQQDVIRAQIELARIDEMKAEQRAAMTSSLAALNHLLYRAHHEQIDSAAELPSSAPLPSMDAVIATALERSPEVAAARQGIQTRKLQIDIAKKNFRPDLVVSGGAMYRGNYDMGPMWQLGVGVSLPVWKNRRQQNQLAEAEARAAEQDAQMDIVEKELEMETIDRFTQLQRANEVATLYHEKLIPLDELSYESALASYQAGKVPFLTVLDAVSSLYGDRASYLALLAQAAKWRVAIDEAGLQPTSMGSAPAMPSGGGGSPAGMSKPASKGSAPGTM